MNDLTSKDKTFVSAEQANGANNMQPYRDYSGPGFAKFKQTDRFATIGAGQKYQLVTISKREAADYSLVVKFALLIGIALFWIFGVWFALLVSSELLSSSFNPVALAITTILFGPIILFFLYLLLMTIPRIIFLLRNLGGGK